MIEKKLYDKQLFLQTEEWLIRGRTATVYLTIRLLNATRKIKCANIYFCAEIWDAKNRERENEGVYNTKTRPSNAMLHFLEFEAGSSRRFLKFLQMNL